MEEDTPERVRLFASQEIEKQIDLQIRDLAINQIKRKNSKEITRLNELFAKADPEYRMARGPKIKDYFNENGELEKATIMNLTLSVDHRVIDGSTGASFLESIVSFLEEPINLLTH